MPERADPSSFDPPRLAHVFHPPRRRIDVKVVPTSFASHAEANRAAWEDAKARLGDKLFDGPMCRFESLDPAPAGPVLRVSRTSYRAFVETNLFGPPSLPDVALSRPIGVSVALETADCRLVLGRRGDGVAYYPNRVHPFAGSLEWPGDGQAIDPFDECRRELREELGLTPAEVIELLLAGIAEDRSLRHPELMFVASTTAALAELRGRLDRAEHDAVYDVPATPAGAEAALRDDSLTPIARAAVRLFARARFGATSRVGRGGGHGV